MFGASCCITKTQAFSVSACCSPPYLFSQPSVMLLYGDFDLGVESLVQMSLTFFCLQKANITCVFAEFFQHLFSRTFHTLWPVQAASRRLFLATAIDPFRWWVLLLPLSLAWSIFERFFFLFPFFQLFFSKFLELLS